jgi:two-component sensor histidine kinase
MVVSMLSMQARLKTNMETRAALEKAIGRIQSIASAHEYFQPREAGGRVEMAAYLGNLCGHLGDGLRDVRPIAVRVDVAEVYLPAEQAAPLGLIVNELVTNALKHAFPEERAGTIDVTLKTEGGLTLCVRDNGVGCPIDRREGLGSRLTRLLAQQLGAQIVSEPGNVGCEVRVVFDRAAVDRPSTRQVTRPYVQSA